MDEKDYFREPAQERRTHPLYVTAEDKDRIIDMLLRSANENGVTVLPESDALKVAGISPGQYEAIIRSFVEEKLIERQGYSYKVTLLQGIYDKREKGGYSMEKEAYMASLSNLALQLEKLQKEASPTIMTKVNGLIGQAKSLTDLIAAWREIRSLLAGE